MDQVALGKKDHKPDARTVMLGTYFGAEITVPHRYNFDKGRAAFPLDMWGNDEWGDCVKVAQANQLVRLERVETRRTVKIDENDVVGAYKQETGSQSPGDARDEGLVMLDNFKLWRNPGWTVAHPGAAVRDYRISVFGELDPLNHQELREACYLLHGVQFGISLPQAAQWMTDRGKWDYPNGSVGSQWAPGSWGGHAVFSKCYDEGGFEVLTWGRKVYMTNNFIDRYCDEAWAVVDSLDTWRKRPEIDVALMEKHLHDIGASVVQ